MKESPWKINIATITEDGLDLSPELGEDWFQTWQEEVPNLDFAGPGAISGTVHMERHGREIFLHGHLEGTLALSCSRCLAAYDARVETDFDLLLEPGPEPVVPEEELTAEELDLDFYQGDVVDLEKYLREQILLMMPLKPLCAESCRGICPRCGADLNHEPCRCPEERPLSPLAAALEKLKK
ncbi:MAG: DUF177 domain-containing protein [Deltaproteobacteria bacterium]|nr:DUF177 domain-containing protein [Deltaproteobacteria bacterium]